MTSEKLYQPLKEEIKAEPTYASDVTHTGYSDQIERRRLMARIKKWTARLPDNQTITRRTITVLVSLICAMTVGSGLLLLLEPGPAITSTPVTLAAVETSNTAVQVNYAPQIVDSERWAAIVIHDSRSASGSAAELDRLHQSLGLDSMAYHFVITNGNGASDGLVEQGIRWRDQADGAHTLGDNAMAKWYNHRAIGICVIADGDNQAPTQAQIASLVKLVRDLQSACRIPAQQVEVSFGTSEGSSKFPTAAFFAQLNPMVGTQ